MWEWDYFIYCGGTRLKQVQGFKTYDNALKSAERSWKKLQETHCIQDLQCGLCSIQSSHTGVGSKEKDV